MSCQSPCKLWYNPCTGEKAKAQKEAAFLIFPDIAFASYNKGLSSICWFFIAAFI